MPANTVCVVDVGHVGGCVTTRPKYVERGDENIYREKTSTHSHHIHHGSFTSSSADDGITLREHGPSRAVFASRPHAEAAPIRWVADLTPLRKTATRNAYMSACSADVARSHAVGMPA